MLIESKSGRQAVRGRFFIDASGDGDLAAWAGVPWEKAPPIDGMMYPSLMFRINGVDVERAGPAPWRTVERLMDEAERPGTHTFPRKKPIVRPQRNPLEWRANLTQLRTADGGAIDGTDVDELTLRRADRAAAGARRVHVHQGPDARVRGLLHRRHRAADRHPRDAPDHRRRTS